MGWQEGRTEPVCAFGWTRQRGSAARGATDRSLQFLANTEAMLSTGEEKS